jgi:hypothetical protein
MNATVVLPPEVAAYLDQVRAALADVPAEERDEMLADLEVSLLEGAADGPPEARLGPPERFAHELRAAAGLATTAPAQPRGLRERLTALADTPRGRAARVTGRELTPVWWVARGYVAAFVFAVVVGLNWSDRYPLIPVRDSPAFGLFLVAGGVVGSVWLGLRMRRRGLRSRALAVANLALAILLLPVLGHSLDGTDGTVTETYIEAAPQDGVAVNGEPVRNIYPYARDGRLLLDVLLFDDQGRPLEVGSSDPASDPLRRYLFTRDGSPLLNSFPIRYVEPGTNRVENPTAALPGMKVPEIRTPPLKVKRP